MEGKIEISKVLSASRLMTIEEQQAYTNLQLYDNGNYQIESLEKIEKILKRPFKDKSYELETLEITQKEIDMYVNFGQMLNKRHSNFNPGMFSEKSAYEASFSKKVYYNSHFEFIVELFISHHNIHAFTDGNKRTALNFFIDLLHKFTNLVVSEIITIQDSQILFLEKHITKQEFKQIIYSEVEKKMFKTNLKCNLEHLIPRGSIGMVEENIVLSQSDRRGSFNLTDLEKGQFFYQQLKKPIFQRDTNQWTVERLEKLIATFLDDGLIPAIILWENSEGDIYIIDGAHRISSLIA